MIYKRVIKRVRIAANPMRVPRAMESDVTLANDVTRDVTKMAELSRDVSKKVLELMDLNDNDKRSPTLKHKLTPDDMENSNEVSPMERSQRAASMDMSTSSGLYFYDDDFNETTCDFNDYQNDIGNDSFFYGQKLLSTKEEYEFDLSMSEKASSQGQSSAYDAASSADQSLTSDQLSPLVSRADSACRLFSSITDKHCLSTDSLDHLAASTLPDEFDLTACCAKKENYMLAFDRSPARCSDEDDAYNDAWLSDAREGVTGAGAGEEEHDKEPDTDSIISDAESAAGEAVFLEDYCSNDQEPLLQMFASTASEALAEDVRSDARILADTSEFLVDLTEESSAASTPVVQVQDDSGCKSASSPSSLPSPTQGHNSTLDEYGSEILGEMEAAEKTEADTFTSYAYDNIFFEAIQHPQADEAVNPAIFTSAPVVGNLMTFSGEEPNSEGCQEAKQRLLKRWSNYEGLNKANLATFATIKNTGQQETTLSMRTSQSIESLPSETKSNTSSTCGNTTWVNNASGKMTTWQQMKKTRAPQTTWKKICQMKEIMKQDESIYQDPNRAKSVPNLSEMCESSSEPVTLRIKDKDEKDPSKRHSFTLFEIFRRAKSEEEDSARLIPSPVYQRMFSSLMRSAESFTTASPYYPSPDAASPVLPRESLKRSLERAALRREMGLERSTDRNLERSADKNLVRSLERSAEQSGERSETDSQGSRSCGVQTSFHEEQSRAIQTSTPPLRRYHSSLDVSQPGSHLAMTRSTSDVTLGGGHSPEKHLTSSMLYGRGQLPDLSFLNRPFGHKEKRSRDRWRGRPLEAERGERYTDHSRLGRSQNSLIIHKRHQQPRRLDHPHIRQLRQIDDSNPETADETELPPRKPKRTFAFSSSPERVADAIPLRRLVPRSVSTDSARSSASCHSDLEHSTRSQSLDNADYCRSRRHSRSSSGSEERSVCKMSVDSDLNSSHRSDSSSGSRKLKSCLTKRQAAAAAAAAAARRPGSRSSSPAGRPQRRRHSTSHYDSYTDEAPHSWDQYDHSLLHRDGSQCACLQCHPPPPSCCHGYRERRRHCRLSYPPCRAHHCCRDAADDYPGYGDCGCYGDSYSCCGGCGSGRQADDGRKKTVSFNEEVRYHSPYHSPFASPKRQVSTDGARKSPPPPVYPERNRNHHNKCGHRPRHSESSSVDSAFESESPPREFLISPTKLHLAETDDSQPDPAVQSKSDLIDDLFRAVDYIQLHFAGAADMREKSHLGTSADCPKIGSLLLSQLCPALYNLLGNGLHLRVRSFFGQVKNNVWKMVEESAELAHNMPVLADIVKEVRSQLHLRNSSAKFNAFVFGLLNAKALDHWFQVLRTQVKLIRKHYDADSMLHVFTTLRGRHLFNDCIRAIRPLASLPFRIECNLEYKYRSTFSDCSTPEIPLTRSLDSEGLPELFEKTDVRQYIQQARDWIEGSKLSESAMDYLGSRFYREFGQFSENKKPNRWSLPPVETMISLANYFSKSPTQRPSPSLEEFAVYLARVNQSLGEEPGREEQARDQQARDELARVREFSRLERIVQDGEVRGELAEEPVTRRARREPRDPRHSYRQTDYQFESLTRVESEPTIADMQRQQGAIPKRNSLPEVAAALDDKKRWSFGSSLINVFDKLLLDPARQSDSPPPPPARPAAPDLPKNMQRRDSPANMRGAGPQPGTSHEEDTPTPKASPVRTWRAVAESTGQVARVSPPRSPAAGSGSSSTPTSPLRTWRSVASPRSSCDAQDFQTPPEDVNANTEPSPDSETSQPEPAVRPRNLLIRHFNTPRSMSQCSGASLQQQRGTRRHNPAKQYVQAVCNHVASNTDQLTFSKGDMMQIVGNFQDDWFYCRRDQQTGLVHKICVQRIWDPSDSY